jgi:hypothetical protein
MEEFPMSTFSGRHPGLVGGAKAVGGAVMKGLELPQQMVANVLAPAIRGEKATPGEALTKPFERTARWIRGESEPTELPGGEISRMVTDPLMYTGVGPAVKAARYAKNIPAGVRAIPPLVGKAAAGELAGGLAPQVALEIPRSWATFSPVQRVAYRRVMTLGRQWFQPDELKEVAETIANLGEHQAAGALKNLGNVQDRNAARSILKWARQKSWERPPTWVKGKPKEEAVKAAEAAQQATPPPGAAATGAGVAPTGAASAGIGEGGLAAMTPEEFGAWKQEIDRLSKQAQGIK